jgi:hypothetical protein
MLYHYSIIGTVKATNLCKTIEKYSKSAKKMKKCAKREKPPLSKGGFSVSKNLPLRGRCPEGAEGENIAIARNISDSRTVLSPTACGRSPLAEGAKG